jgi:hypothetical protein
MKQCVLTKTTIFWPTLNKKKGCQTTIVHHLQRLYLKGCSGGYFQWHLMPHLSTKQDKQDTTLMVWHRTTPQCNSWWLVISVAAAAPLQRGLPNQHLQPNFIACDDDFWSKIGILYVWIKNQDLFPIKTKYPSFFPYKYG